MDDDRRDQEIAATLIMLGLKDLEPQRIHNILRHAGVYAPAVSSTEHVVARLSDVLKNEPHGIRGNSSPRIMEEVLETMRRQTIQYVSRNYEQAVNRTLADLRMRYTAKDLDTLRRPWPMSKSEQEHLQRVLDSYKSRPK